MLIKARYARLANAQAPRQEKAANAAARLRALFGPSMRLWIDGAHDSFAVGSTAVRAFDRSGQNVSVQQLTVANRPLRSAVGGIAGWTFDGTDDRFNCGNIDLSAAAKATVLVVNRLAVAGGTGILFEVGENGAVNGGMQVIRYDATARFAANSHQAASFNGKYIASSTASWFCHGVVIDRSLAAASECTMFANGSVVAGTATASAELSLNFENRSGMIGGWSAGAATLNGQIAQVLVLTGALTSAQVFDASRLLLQLSGVA